LVANIAVGYDNIDLAAAIPHGVMVPNAPDILTRRDINPAWEALVEALRQGVIAGLAPEVVEREPVLAPGLVEFRGRVVPTPHRGSTTESKRRRMSAMVADNVLALASSHVPPNLVGAAAS
jgi:lactate dehydrogenase-like 2-hydroxyacid dehydrogenase